MHNIFHHKIGDFKSLACVDKIVTFRKWVFCRPTYICLEKLWHKSNNKKWINATNDVSNF